MSEPARENGVKIAIETMATLGDYRAYCADFAELRALIERNALMPCWARLR